MNQTAFRTANEVEDFVCNFWSELILDEVPLMFREWMALLELVCENDRECLPE
jgi:hypothetical protein